jgi:hypothetical protein
MEFPYRVGQSHFEGFAGAMVQATSVLNLLTK